MQEFYKGSVQALSRALSLVENGSPESSDLLAALEPAPEPAIVAGVTGPPGSGKSTLLNAITAELLKQGKRVAILAVDPTSPFHGGALLGDRVRMQAHFSDPRVYIRSVATRGALGGLSGTCMEMTDVLKAFGFDYIFVETVGVGQSEVEIAALADTTLVVLVPEAGDDIQSLKSGLMEIADLFVVNKSDREGARELTIVLQRMLHERPAGERPVPVIQSVATKGEGVVEIIAQIRANNSDLSTHRRALLLAEKAFRLIMKRRTEDVDRSALLRELELQAGRRGFNLYQFVRERY